MSSLPPLRISTMTAAGHFGAKPNSGKLFDSGYHIPYWWMGEGIIKMEYRGEIKGACSKDLLKRTTTTKKTKNTKFLNQSSLVIRIKHPDNPSAWKEVNVKLFNDGAFQMTGISSDAMGRLAIERLMALNADRGIWDSPPSIKSFKLCNIMAYLDIGKSIRRDRLYTILTEEYSLWVVFEPTIYQGVCTKIYWNKTRPANIPFGVCVCPTPCKGGGDGYSVGQCKKITISPFRTGSIVVAGAQSMEQLHDSCLFMVDVIRKNEATVLWEPAANLVKKAESKKTLMTASEILHVRARTSIRGTFSL